MKKVQRVRLVREITPELPYGSQGTVDNEMPKLERMVWVKWDLGFEIAMFRSEIEYDLP